MVINNMRTILASELDEYLKNLKIIDEDEEYSIYKNIVTRHPSNRGSIIVPFNIFVPDGIYRILDTPLMKSNGNVTFNDRFFTNGSIERNPRVKLLQNLQECNRIDSIRINEAVLDYNEYCLHRRNFPAKITVFNTCNDIKIPGVEGTCIIPSYAELKILYDYREILDYLDSSTKKRNVKKRLNEIFSSYSTIISSSLFINTNRSKSILYQTVEPARYYLRSGNHYLGTWHVDLIPIIKL